MPNKTRQIEMLVAVTYGDSNGPWHTEFVDIPYETPEDDIEEVACDRWWAEYKKSNRKDSIAGLEIYWIPELEEFSVAYVVLKDIPVHQDSGSDPKFIPLGSVVYEVESHNNNVDPGKILVEYTPDGPFDARAPFLYMVNEEDLEDLNG